MTSEASRGVDQQGAKGSSRNSQAAKGKDWTWKSFNPGKLQGAGVATDDKNETDGRQIATTLRFVNVDEPMLPPNESRRRAVRRHVMRDFHKKKRGETTPNNAGPAQQNFPTVGPESPQSFGRLHVFDASGQPGSSRNLTSFDRHMSNVLSTLEWSNTSGISLASVTRSPQPFDAWLYDTTIPFMVRQAEDAPTFYFTSRNWPFPRQLCQPSHRTSIWMPDEDIPPMNLRLPRVCSNLVHPAISNTHSFLSFKLETIKWINRRLDDLDKGTNDATIGSILLLTTLETCRGNIDEALQHRNGLRQIVAIRGGVHSFSNRRHFLLKLFITDLIVAIVSENDPVFGSLPTLMPSSILGPKQDVVAASPLHCFGPINQAIKHPAFCEDSVAILQRLQDLTILAVVDAESLMMRNVTMEYLLSLQTAQSDPPNLLRIIHLTASIFARALDNPPLAFISTPNREMAIELCVALRATVHDAVFDRYPGVLVWILLTASAAIDVTHPEHGAIVTFLTRVALGAGYGWWEELNLAMRAFLKIKIRANSRRVEAAGN